MNYFERYTGGPTPIPPLGKGRLGAITGWAVMWLLVLGVVFAAPYIWVIGIWAVILGVPLSFAVAIFRAVRRR